MAHSPLRADTARCNVIAFPKAAKRRQRRQAQADQPEADIFTFPKRYIAPPFDPSNPAHMDAWETMYRAGRQARAEREGR